VPNIPVQMDAFLAGANPGLSSRFSECIAVEAFTAAQAAQLGASLWASTSGQALSRAGDDALRRACARLAAAPGWSSGRDVDTLVRKAARKAALRVHGADGGGRSATDPNGDAHDIDAAAAEMLAQASRSVASAVMAMQAAVGRPQHGGSSASGGGGGGGGGARAPPRRSYHME
jgi:hypothetical protein